MLGQEELQETALLIHGKAAGELVQNPIVAVYSAPLAILFRLIP